MVTGRPRGWRISRPALNARLDALAITQAELARRAEISESQLSSLCTRGTGASRKTANALALAAECEVGLLFPEAAGFGAPTGDAA